MRRPYLYTVNGWSLLALHMNNMKIIYKYGHFYLILFTQFWQHEENKTNNAKQTLVTMAKLHYSPARFLGD